MKLIQRWGSAPIVVPRWLLVMKYVLFVTLGVVLAIAGSPSIAEATSGAYLLPYGAALACTALLALVGCTIDKETAEMVGALLLWCTLLVYVGAVAGRAFSGDLGTQAISIVILIVSLLPMARGVGILGGLIRNRVTRAGRRAS